MQTRRHSLKNADIWKENHGPFAILRDLLGQPVREITSIPQPEDTVEGGSFQVAGGQGSFFVYKAYGVDGQAAASPASLHDVPVAAQVIQHMGPAHPLPNQMSELMETGTPTLI